MPYAVLFAPAGSDDFEPVEGETYETGPFAATRMKELQASHGSEGRYKVRQVAEPGADPDAWRRREREHFDYARYVITPWHDDYRNDELRWEHYAHLSLTEPGKIAYTASAEHGRADRQTLIAPGRYLTRYFKDSMSADEIERYASEVSVSAGNCELHFTSCPDEIENVYTSGPYSCMSHDESDYDGHYHPVRAYGNSPDLQLAYTGNEEDGYSGRVIVWPDKKLYSTIYGDRSRMRLLLQNAGYEHGSMSGARLKPIHDENEKGLIMPYIDDISRATMRDGFVVLGSGMIYCQSTNGTTEADDRSYCESCGDRTDDDELNYIEDVSEHWCDSCTQEHATHCEHSGEYYSDRLNSFHQVYSFCSWAGWTSQTVAERNLEDADAIYCEEISEYVRADTFNMAELVKDLARHFAATNPDQLPLAFETIALEQLAVAA
jgi:hypothetical protein